MALRIEDYGLIGDCHTAALVGRDGSIDWLCMPRFDSPACFASLLGKPENGRWRLAPAEGVAIKQVRRKYRGETLVLETEFETDQGTAAVIDFMPPGNDRHAIVRIVEGRSGRVPMHLQLIMRFDYGKIIPWVRKTAGHLWGIAGPDMLRHSTPVTTHGEGPTTAADFEIGEGDRIPFVLVWTPSHAPEAAEVDAEAELRATEAWWAEWVGHCTYHGEWREAVVRSLITLKALTYAPTGAIVAAPTTSLPEYIGGVRNWDYRYCWVRDASFTLMAFISCGYMQEAYAWRQWLLRAAAGEPSKLQIMYGIAGERRLTEMRIPWLKGYENSPPVRIGNAAWRQRQIDVYGEVLDAMYFARLNGLVPQGANFPIERALITYLEKAWRKPDHGIWEVRGPRKHFTHSKLMSWVAFDRAVKAVEKFDIEDRGHLDRWRAIRDEIHEEICAKGYDPEINAFVQSYGSKCVDASLLLMPIFGFLPGDDPRILGTIRAVEERLKSGPFIERYDSGSGVDGLPKGEGAFLLCSFWLADCYSLAGRRADARRLFEQLLAIRNDLGLLAEEYDSVHDRLVGNFPQAFSHIGLIASALIQSRTVVAAAPSSTGNPE
ncbi:MAG: glucoamylase [Planctomycetes bacterium SCN 63-9]|nr:MAG: glucoamylase [Planctomycetes bacterium SCN 63-9]